MFQSVRQKCRQLVEGMASRMEDTLTSLTTEMQTAGLEAERVRRICQQVCFPDSSAQLVFLHPSFACILCQQQQHA